MESACRSSKVFSRLCGEGTYMRNGLFCVGIGLALTTAGASIEAAAAPGVAVVPGKMSRVGTVDERFQSFNVEMLEVTGGRFWAPYNAAAAPVDPEAAKMPTPAGMDPSLYRYRAP